MSLAAIIFLLAAGCVVAQEDSISAGATEQTLIVANKLTANKLTANKLTANKLTANSLSTSRLADDSLNFNAADGGGIETTEDGREVLKYLAKCALDEDVILTVTHDGTTYSYPGLLGLAPEWETRALLDSEKWIISACLFAHINAYQVSITMSARSYDVLSADAAEQHDFPVYEGTFFGMAFVDEDEDIKWYSCQGDDERVALAQSSDRALRVCTDSSPDCEVIALGRCRDICEDHSAAHGWRNCWAEGTRYTETLSTFLPADQALVETCGSMETCTLLDKLSSPADTPAILDCSEASACEASCGAGGHCTLDGTAAAAFTAVAEDNAIADVNCLDSGSCKAACKSGSDCAIDCKNAGTCTGVQCESGASCLLDCTGATECAFSLCPSGAVRCPGDIVVCGRKCP